MDVNKLLKNAIDELHRQIINEDTEMAHIRADEVLCNLLKELGFGLVVDEYRRVDKWYA